MSSRSIKKKYKIKNPPHLTTKKKIKYFQFFLQFDTLRLLLSNTHVKSMILLTYGLMNVFVSSTFTNQQRWRYKTWKQAIYHTNDKLLRMP